MKKIKKDLKIDSLIRIILAILALVEGIYILIQPTPREGLEMMWIIPLLFSAVLFWGGNLIKFSAGGVGLKVYYIIAIIRYMVQPYLIIISKGALSYNRMPNAKSSSYKIAIFIYCLELIIAVLTIRFFYPRYKKKLLKKDDIISETSLSLRKSGWIVMIFLILILLVRINKWLPSMNILFLKESKTNLPILLEATILNCIKAFVFVNFLNLALNSKGKSLKYWCYFLFTIISGILNFTIYFGSNRSFIVESALATIMLLIYEFPRYKKRILVILIPIAIIIIFNMFVTKQFGLEDANEFSYSILNIQSISNIIEEYVNGLWTVARSYQASIGISFVKSIQAFIKDITDGLMVVLDIPGLKWISSLTNNYMSSSSIMKYTLNASFDRGQMLSFSAGLLISGGKIFGWPLLILGNYLAIKCLVILDLRTKYTSNKFEKYAYLWTSILFGLTHCYCMQTIIYCWSKFMLLYWIILKINNKFKIK